MCSTLLAFLGVWFYPCSHQRPSTPVNEYGYESIPVRSPVCLFRFSTWVSGFRVFRENCADSDGPDVLVTVEAPRVAYGTDTRIKCDPSALVVRYWSGIPSLPYARHAWPRYFPYRGFPQCALPCLMVSEFCSSLVVTNAPVRRRMIQMAE